VTIDGETPYQRVVECHDIRNDGVVIRGLYIAELETLIATAFEAMFQRMPDVFDAKMRHRPDWPAEAMAAAAHHHAVPLPASSHHAVMHHAMPHAAALGHRGKSIRTVSRGDTVIARRQTLRRDHDQTGQSGDRGDRCFS